MAGKKGAPFGNKNAIGQHSGFGIGLAHGALLTPIGSTVAGFAGGALAKNSEFLHKQKSGSTLGGAIGGGIGGGLAAGPAGAVAGALGGALFSRLGTSVGQWAGKKVNPNVIGTHSGHKAR